MTITTQNHESDGTAIFANGERFIIVTRATESTATQKLIKLCEDNDTELCRLTAAAKERREWNFANPGKGKDWPAFRQLERFVDQLCKAAGIKDS